MSNIGSGGEFCYICTMGRIVILAVAAALALCTCGNSGGGDVAGVSKDIAVNEGNMKVASDTVKELPLPEIPRMLTTPSARAGYLALHFWDNMDFSDHSLSLDSVFMGQNFANYISVFPMIEEREKAADAMNRLVSLAGCDSASTAFLTGIADMYLLDPNSPMRNEEIMILYSEAMLKSGSPSEASRQYLEWVLVTAAKNRRGSIAADFLYTTREGRKRTLHKRVKEGKTMLVFYNPDCGNCKVILSQLASMRIPAGISVLAVDSADDRRRWDETKSSMPAAWEVGFAMENIEDEGLYYIPAVPAIYLLDKGGRVILKDPTLEQLSSYFDFITRE